MTPSDPTPRGDRVIQAIVSLATAPCEDPIEVYTDLVRQLVDLLDLRAAAVVVADSEGDLRMLASSSEEARILELLELHVNAGPCLESYRTGRAACYHDPEELQPRWPALRDEMLHRGLTSVCSVPLMRFQSPVGALNLFSGAQISSEDIGVAEALSSVATACLSVSGELKAARQLAQQLQEALNSRIVIEQAKGVIAEKREVNMDTAFSLLRETARSAQVRLVDLAYNVASRRLDVTEAIERVTGERG